MTPKQNLGIIIYLISVFFFKKIILIIKLVLEKYKKFELKSII